MGHPSGVRNVGKTSRTYAVLLIGLLLSTAQPGLSTGGQASGALASKKGKHTGSPRAKNNRFRDAMHFDDGWLDGVDLWVLPIRYDGSDLDIFAGALSAAKVNRAASMPVPNESVINLFAIQAAFLNLCNGDLVAANKYSKMVTDGTFAYNQPEPFYMCTSLEAAGLTRDSQILHKACPYMAPKRTAEQRLGSKDDADAEDQVKSAYPLITHCLDATGSGDRTAAIKYAGQLLRCLRCRAGLTTREERAGLRSESALISFGALLNIARRFSDRKWSFRVGTRTSREDTTANYR